MEVLIAIYLITSFICITEFIVSYKLIKCMGGFEIKAEEQEFKNYKFYGFIPVANGIYVVLLTFVIIVLIYYYFTRWKK